MSRTYLIDGAAVFESATSPDGLGEGWLRVWSNRGAAGGDGMSCEQFSLEAHRRLKLLSDELRNGDYRPSALRQVDIPKKSGGLRTLRIPSVRDRVAQSAVAIALTPLLDAEFADGSYGYRPGRSVRQAVEHVRRLRAQGYIWTVDADIERYFDTIPHDALMARILRSISAGPLTELIELWLEASGGLGRGLPQGSPIAPLLANLYLDDMDDALSTKGVRVVRFADDFVLLAKDRETAERALEAASAHLAGRGLAIHTGKTRLRGYDETVRFLGHLFVRSLLMTDTGDDRVEADALLAKIGAEDRRAADDAARVAAGKEAEAEAGYDRALRVLHVREQGRRLGLKNLSFAVTENDETSERRRLLAAVHFTRLERIELGPGVDADLATLKHALASDIHVAFVDGHGETLGFLAPSLSPHAGRHLAQARHRLDDALRLDLARRFVDGRLRNQRALLRRLNQRRGLQEPVAVLTGLNRWIRKLAIAKSVDELNGMEGAATKSYWRAWSALLLHGFSLAARKRKAAPDPANIILNVAASLLTRDIGAVLTRRGLHPGFGVLHAAANAHDGAVYDLMEEFRAPMVEGLALYAINNRIVTTDHFHRLSATEIRLRAEGMKAVVRAYEERAASLVKSPRSGDRVTWRRLMFEQAEALAAHVEGRDAYRPYVMDY